MAGYIYNFSNFLVSPFVYFVHLPIVNNFVKFYLHIKKDSVRA